MICIGIFQSAFRVGIEGLSRDFKAIVDFLQQHTEFYKESGNEHLHKPDGQHLLRLRWECQNIRVLNLLHALHTQGRLKVIVKIDTIINIYGAEPDDFGACTGERHKLQFTQICDL